MPIWIMILLGLLIGLPGVALLLGWIGLQIHPAAFPPYPEREKTFTRAPLPEGLPAPVARFYRTICGGEDFPILRTAVITGRAALRFNGITFPARMRFTLHADHGYRHYIEAAVFGYPLLRVNERYLDGAGVMELPFGTIEDEPKVNAGGNQGFWGEAMWLPTLYLTDPRVRWEAIDDTQARLVVPFGAEEQVFTVRFDADSGLLTAMETMRWKGAEADAPTRWTLAVTRWTTFDGLRVPAVGTATWADEGVPWLVMTVEDIAYNADIDDYIRARGL